MFASVFGNAAIFEVTYMQYLTPAVRQEHKITYTHSYFCWHIDILKNSGVVTLTSHKFQLGVNSTQANIFWDLIINFDIKIFSEIGRCTTLF